MWQPNPGSGHFSHQIDSMHAYLMAIMSNISTSYSHILFTPYSQNVMLPEETVSDSIINSSIPPTSSLIPMSFLDGQRALFAPLLAILFVIGVKFGWSRFRDSQVLTHSLNALKSYASSLQFLSSSTCYLLGTSIFLLSITHVIYKDI